MNRIILVGNGFDLAHGLPTSYKHFINAYCRHFFHTFFKQNGYGYEDILLSIKRRDHAYPEYIPTPDVIEDAIAYLDDFQKQHSKQYQIEMLSPIFSRTRYDLAEKNWVDIEMVYFEQLCEYVKDGRLRKGSVEAINEQLTYIRTLLETYLTSVQTHAPQTPDPDLLSIFMQPIYWEDIALTSKKVINRRQLLASDDPEKGNIQQTMIVNFNYTNTVEPYLEAMKANGRFKNTTLNYIHGKLGSNENPPIFGFGDEYDKTYNTFEDYRENCLFEHVKSYRYFLTPNNKNLLRFSDQAPFQVFILGHSCGVSDRTMLKSIFESPNCKSIKIFHHNRADGTNDYHQKSIDLGRHFSDKGYMRRIIADYQSENYMPQPYLKNNS